jgi:pimeloyl-ACP methyl ester carboxylesterase
MEIPVWQEPIQLAMKKGIDFVAVNYRGSLGFGTWPAKEVTNEQRVDDIVGAIEYVHRGLDIPYSQIILLGHSAGANLAASVALKRPAKIGLLLLVSFEKAAAFPVIAASNKDLPTTLGFYPEYEGIPFSVIDRNLVDLFGNMVYDENRMKMYVLRDDHNLMYPSSWADVYSIILGQFGMGGCAQH